MQVLRGKFFAIEGGEGAGKSTLLMNLRRTLDPNLFSFTREPGGTPFAEEMRATIFANNDDPFKELCLFFAARRDHILKNIRPKLERGVHVITDRYVASTYAYQIGAPKNWHLEDCFGAFVRCAEVSRDPYDGTVLQTNYIWLDIDPEVGLSRVRSRSGERTSFDDRELGFHQGVRRGFQRFFQYGLASQSHFATPNWHQIDASKAEQDITAEAIRHIQGIIGG